MPRDTERGREALGKALMALFWTSGYIVGALATAHTPALTVSFWRLLVATPPMAAIALVAKARWPRGSELLYVVPALTAIAAVPVLGQSLRPGVIVGLVLSLAGVYMVGGGRAQRSSGLRSGHVQKHQNALQLRSTGQ